MDPWNGPDMEPLKEIQKYLWSLGDYPQIARVTEAESGELARACGLGPGMEVLDVGAGTGNFAVAAARLGATVVASDITPRMIELGRQRCEADGLKVEWFEADAEDLPFEADRFDCCGSMFGSMFAPRPDVVAAEMFRVTKPQGAVAMANWTPDGFVGRLLALATSYAPQPSGDVPSPLEWGDPDVVQARLGPHADTVGIGRRSARFEFESKEQGLEWGEANLGPLVALRSMLPPESYQELVGRIVSLTEAFDQGPGDRVVIDSEFLAVVARKR